MVQLNSEIEVVRRVLDELQSGFSSFSAQTIPRDDLPAVAAEYLNLSGDLQLQEQLYSVLRQQYELTRIDETDPSRTFQVIEPVEVPEVRHRPNRALVCMIGSLTALLVSILAAFFLEYLVRVRSDPVEAAKLAAIPRQPARRRRIASERLSGRDRIRRAPGQEPPRLRARRAGGSAGHWTRGPAAD